MAPVEVSAHRGQVRALRAAIATTGASGEARARGFIAGHAEAFGLRDAATELTLLEEVAVPGGGAVVRFARKMTGHPVFGAEIRVVFDASGRVVFVTAGLPLPTAIPGEPAVSAPEAETTAIAAATARGATDPLALGRELGIFDRFVLTGVDGPTRLAWRVTLDGPAPHLPALVYVDAQDRSVLLASNTVYRARQRRIYAVGGGSGQPRDILEGLRTLLFEEGAPPPGDQAPAQIQADYAAYEHAGRAHAYFFGRFGWDGPDGRGAPIDVYLRFGGDSQWALDSIFLDPSGAPSSQVSLDDLAHEYTHGVVNHLLDGSSAPHDDAKVNEAGALREFLSDVFATFAGFASPDVTGDWLMLDGSGSIYRDLTQRSVAYRTVAWYGDRKLVPAGHEWDDDKDKGFVHDNSAIGSLAIHLLVAGGRNPARSDGVVDVVGIGAEKAEQILFRALRYYQRSTGGFEDLRYTMLRACEELVSRAEFSLQTRDCGSVLNAWAAVGVGPWDRDRDTWHDGIDNCKLDFNPGQENGDGDDLGDACDTSSTDPGAPPEYPSQPPALPTCPEEFVTSYRATGLTEGRWPLQETRGPTLFDTWLLGPVEGPRDIREFTYSCHYWSPANHSSYRLVLTAWWQPYDPVLYQVTHRACHATGDTEIKFNSSTHMASVGGGGGSSGLLGDEKRSFITGFLPQVEALAAPCP